MPIPQKNADHLMKVTPGQNGPMLTIICRMLDRVVLRVPELFVRIRRDDSLQATRFRWSFGDAKAFSRRPFFVAQAVAPTAVKICGQIVRGHWPRRLTG
jgi:hypothetical protein